jgi:hypothetical protein
VSVCTIALNVGIRSIFWPKDSNFTEAFRGLTHFDEEDSNYRLYNILLTSIP